MLGQSPQSKQLREGIIEEILHKQLEDVKILNPETVPDVSVGKEIRLDNLLKEKGHQEVSEWFPLVTLKQADYIMSELIKQMLLKFLNKQ